MSMSNYNHQSKFGYFYDYCINSKESIREIDKLKDILEKINNMDSPNNNVHNKKIARKSLRIERLILSIVCTNPKFISDFNNSYQKEYKECIKESDLNLVAKNISQSFYDLYIIKEQKNNNIVTKKNKYKRKESDIVLNLSKEEKDKLDLEDKKSIFQTFAAYLMESNYSHIFRQLKDIAFLYRKNSKNKEITSTDIDKAYHNLDLIFKKGYNYPFRKDFIKILSKVIYLYDLDERTFSDLNNCLKNSLYLDLTAKSLLEKDTENIGYEIPSDTSTNTIIMVNDELEKEKTILMEKYKRGEKINFNKPFSSNIQTKKVEMINSFFDDRFEFHLTSESKDEEYVRVVIDLNELSEDITNSLFKRVLFDAHDSSNLAHPQSFKKNEALRTLYSLYSPEDKLERYLKARNKFENIFKTLPDSKRDNIHKLVNIEKQKKNITTNELLANRKTIMDNLVVREKKFIDSHAVEEFRFKALNRGKYLNYDLEIVARDIDIDDLPALYEKLKRNIIYSDFTTSDNDNNKGQDNRIIRNKTLAVAQEMIAKTILNKSYDRNEDISYDSYQNILNGIYENVLHEKRLLRSYDDFSDEVEILENNYQDKKKIWDEHSAFVQALYLVISGK